MNPVLRNVLALSAVAIAAQASAQVTFYERSDFGGRSFTTERRVGNFDRYGFNDRASSVVVTHDRWEVCEDAGFRGHCVVLRPGSYPSLAAMGLNNSVSSVRSVSGDARISEDRYAPLPPVAAYDDFHRRHGERLYQANVLQVRAVVGPPEQRCWTEQQAVTTQQRNPNVPGAIAGAVIGGILGHQVGGGFGRDVATAGGVVAGAAVGSRAGDGREVTTLQPVQRCTTMPASSRPDYWDVTYNFRGLEHRVQMTAPPGATVTVNGNGEPRS